MSAYITPLPASFSAPTASTAGGKRVLSIFGSTGSIGVNALRVVSTRPELFQVAALAGGSNAELLAAQAREFRPLYLAVKDEQSAQTLRTLLPTGYSPKIFVGMAGFAELATAPEPDLLLLAQSGAAGLQAAIAAAGTGKILALANKESLVLAGGLIKKLCRDSGAIILPVDSEHNAIFQVSRAENDKGLRRLWLTASGGPFRGFSKERLAQVSAAQALAHPRWNMGAKISVDSATLMNKGLEIIEAAHLFGMESEDIQVLVHPQSIVHSLVEFIDGSLLAQMGCPDMRIPISYCLTWPERIEAGQPSLNLLEHPQLTFEEPDQKAFPCLNLARMAMRGGPWSPIILNAANEIAVDLFLHEQISFPRIAELVEQSLETDLATSFAGSQLNLENILALDKEVRLKTSFLAKIF